MVDCLAQIVQKTCPLGDTDIDTDFLSQKTGQLRNLYGMLQGILPVRGTILHTA